MMEFWLINNASNESLLLPVSPAEYQISHSNGIEIVRSIGLGDINIPSYKNLMALTLSSFFPNRDYDFLKRKLEYPPMHYVKIIESWIDKKSIIQVIITDGITQRINKNFLIESITIGETFETNGDINYSISLREYKALKVEAKTREFEKPKPNAKTYKVVQGDSLWRIARKMYGDPTLWEIIYNANKAIIKNPNLIYVGQVFTIPDAPKTKTIKPKKSNIKTSKPFVGTKNHKGFTLT